jgi:hypothetical protein
LDDLVIFHRSYQKNLPEQEAFITEYITKVWG